MYTHFQTWRKVYIGSFRSETYLNLERNHCMSPANHLRKTSPRDEKDQWYGGSGNIKDLITSFQDKAQEVGVAHQK